MDFRLIEPRPQQPSSAPPFREWLLPDGEVWMQFFRTDAGYALRFPELADFEISADALAVICIPVPGVSDETHRHLFLNQVLPLVLSKRGKMVFHASAIEVAGVAVAFVADSGQGKSTLAASFAANGFRFLCDDGLVLENCKNGFEAMPSHPSIRLWDDSRESLIGSTAQTAPPVEYTAKSRLLAGSGIEFCEQPRLLRRVYFLGDGSAPALSLQKLGASDALAEWVKHAFLLDPNERPLIAAHFDGLVALAHEGIAYRLDFPRCYAALVEVRRAVVAQICDEEKQLAVVR
jgi:hypothetical protein